MSQAIPPPSPPGKSYSLPDTSSETADQCPYCGREITSDDLFCPDCDTPLTSSSSNDNDLEIFPDDRDDPTEDLSNTNDNDLEYYPDDADDPTDKFRSLDSKKLGFYLDGWADLIEYKGDQAEKVYETTIDILSQRFPVAPVDEHSFTVNSAAHDKTRSYAATKNWPGAITTIYVGARGDDLYVAWRTYIKPIINFLTLIIIGIVAFVAGLAVAVSSDGNISFFLFVIIVILVAGMSASLVAFAGRLLKGYSSAYFIEEISIFNAEDITAMSMAAHKSLHRALDKEGIDVTQLRLKQNFVGGRRGETI